MSSDVLRLEEKREKRREKVVFKDEREARKGGGQ